MTFAVLITTFLVAAVCIFLVLHPDYDDGLIGNLSLGAIGIAAFARMWSILEGAQIDNPVAAVLWCGLAVFLLRHTLRFMTFRKRDEEECDQSEQ